MEQLPTEKAYENIYEFIQMINPENLEEVENNFRNLEVDYQLKDAPEDRKSLEVMTRNKQEAKRILHKIIHGRNYGQ